MTLNLSPQMRVVAVVAGLAALAMPVGFFVLGRQAASGAAEVKDVTPLYAGKNVGATPSMAKATPAKTAAPAGKAAPVEHTVRAVRKAQPAAKRAKKPPAPAKVPNPHGLPPLVARALTGHPVVVVSLYDPEAKVDTYSVNEAEAGAKLAGVGFVRLNVLVQAQSGALMRKLGVLPDPALLIFRRPGDLALRVDGFVDRDTVAQAAANVSPVPLVAAAKSTSESRTLEAWARAANRVCADADERLSAIRQPRTRAEIVARGPRMLALNQERLRRLRALPLPIARADRAAVVAFLTLRAKAEAADRRTYEVLAGGGSDQAISAAIAAEAPFYAEANGRAKAIGATGCMTTADGLPG